MGGCIAVWSHLDRANTTAVSPSRAVSIIFTTFSSRPPSPPTASTLGATMRRRTCSRSQSRRRRMHDSSKVQGHNEKCRICDEKCSIPALCPLGVEHKVVYTWNTQSEALEGFSRHLCLRKCLLPPAYQIQRTRSPGMGIYCNVTSETEIPVPIQPAGHSF